MTIWRRRDADHRRHLPWAPPDRPGGRDTRPTSDRVREAMFSTIESELGPLSGLRVIDLYAGSGALGLEALSRGAEHALLVESDARAVRAIRTNVAALGLPGAEVMHASVARALAEPGTRPYDLALADPPCPGGRRTGRRAVATV